MIHAWNTVRLGRSSRADPQWDGLRTRLLIRAAEVILAIGFVPLLLLAIVLVGIFMAFEWSVLRVGAAIRGDDWPLREPPWRRFGVSDDDSTRDRGR
jgi:hypothetical protein